MHGTDTCGKLTLGQHIVCVHDWQVKPSWGIDTCPVFRGYASNLFLFSVYLVQLKNPFTGRQPHNNTQAKCKPTFTNARTNLTPQKIQDERRIFRGSLHHVHARSIKREMCLNRKKDRRKIG